MTVRSNQGSGEKEGRREKRLMKRGWRKEYMQGEEVERNKDINSVFSQRDDPWPSRGIWFIWLSG